MENAIITSNDFASADLLKSITIIKDMASAYAAQLMPEEYGESIAKFRHTIEFMIDFYAMHSPHFDVRSAILADFDKLIANQVKVWQGDGDYTPAIGSRGVS